MRIFTAAVLTLASILGCNETKESTDQAGSDRPQKLMPVNPPSPTKEPGVAPAQPVAQDMPNVPDGAQWTIYCTALSGPQHMPRAKQLKADLARTTGLKDWYLIHRENESVLYYGFYRTYDARDPKNPSDGARAQAERNRIDAIEDARGDRPFRHAVFVRLDAPDPTAPPEWDLANIRQPSWLIEDPDKPFWSLQIAAYKDSPNRKQFAVDAVRAARAQGIEAYYFHGETASSVLVGAWPRRAVREQEWDGGARGEGNNADAGAPILVLPEQLPKNVDPDKIVDAEGNRMKTVAPVTEIVDPTLLAARRQFPDHAVNGEVNVRTAKDPKTGQVRQVSDPSFLVQIPQRAGDGSLITSVDSGNPGELPIDAPPPPPSQGGSGRGKLKSIGK